MHAWCNVTWYIHEIGHIIIFGVNVHTVGQKNLILSWKCNLSFVFVWVLWEQFYANFFVFLYNVFSLFSYSFQSLDEGLIKAIIRSWVNIRVLFINSMNIIFLTKSVGNSVVITEITGSLIPSCENQSGSNNLQMGCTLEGVMKP